MQRTQRLTVTLIQKVKHRSHWSEMRKAGCPRRCASSCSQPAPAQHCKGVCCQTSLQPFFTLAQGTPEQTSPWTVFTPWGFLTALLTIKSFWVGYRPSRLFKMPQATRWPAWQSLLVRIMWAIWNSLQQEIKQQALKPPDSHAMAVSIVYGTEHPECLKSVQRHQFVVTQFSIAVWYIQPISFFLLWLVPETSTFWKKRWQKRKAQIKATPCLTKVMLNRPSCHERMISSTL